MKILTPGTILKCIDTQDPSNTFTMTYLSGYIDVTPEEVVESGPEHLSYRCCVSVMHDDGSCESDMKLWIHTDGGLSLSNGWLVKHADTQNALLFYLLDPANASTRVRTLIEWLDCGLVELSTNSQQG